MPTYAFRLVNVFAESTLAGNPLAVVEDARGLDDATMQAFALQFNLSETTFLLPSGRATARVRIFTPTFEMPFAGHPTLGTAHVVRELSRAGDRLTLEMGVEQHAGHFAEVAVGEGVAGAVVLTLEDDQRVVAGRIGLDAADVAGPPLWVDTGSDQLVIPLASFDAVRRATPRPEAMLAHASNGTRSMAYVFAREGNRVLARFFFPKHGAVIEDPGTGSACANLGGWLLATGAALPQKLAVDQGEAVGRPCRLGLEVTADRRIRVSGRVIEIARGELRL